jgi:PPOX class probable F420-dependent enzyme
MMAPILTTLRMTPVVPAVGIARASAQIADGIFSATEQQDAVARIVLGELARLSDELHPLRPAPPEPPVAPDRTTAPDPTTVPDPTAAELRGDPALLALLGARGRGVLATNAVDGRPHLSVVDYACGAADRRVRVSVTAGRVKTGNITRDPRASLQVSIDEGSEWAVAEGTASLSPVANGVDDPVLDELIDLYRAVNGEHPDWDDYRRAMVADRRQVLSLDVERVYGLRRG